MFTSNGIHHEEPISLKNFIYLTEHMSNKQDVFVKHYAETKKVQKPLVLQRLQTRSLTLLPFEKALLVEYAYQLCGLYLLQLKSYSKG